MKNIPNFNSFVKVELFKKLSGVKDIMYMVDCGAIFISCTTFQMQRKQKVNLSYCVIYRNICRLLFHFEFVKMKKGVSAFDMDEEYSKI